MGSKHIGGFLVPGSGFRVSFSYRTGAYLPTLPAYLLWFRLFWGAGKEEEQEEVILLYHEASRGAEVLCV